VGDGIVGGSREGQSPQSKPGTLGGGDKGVQGSTWMMKTLGSHCHLPYSGHEGDRCLPQTYGQANYPALSVSFPHLLSNPTHRK
jgi:hypothetical protein